MRARGRLSRQTNKPKLAPRPKLDRDQKGQTRLKREFRAFGAKGMTLFVLCTALASTSTTLLYSEMTIAAASTSDLCEAALPPTIKKELSEKYKGWKVLEIPDLISDDQILWEATAGEQACPGVAGGDFKGNGQNSYAVALIRASKPSPRVSEKLVFVEKKDNTYLISELFSADDVPISVVERGPPGEYRDFYDETKRVKVATDTILRTRLEARTVAYYFNGKTFAKILVSD